MKIINGDLYIDQVEELIYEYTEYLNRDLSFQNLERNWLILQKSILILMEDYLYVLKIIK